MGTQKHELDKLKEKHLEQEVKEYSSGLKDDKY
jgi:hypothetical protein